MKQTYQKHTRFCGNNAQKVCKAKLNQVKRLLQK